MKNLINTTSKNCLAILFMVIATMIFSVSNSNAQGIQTSIQVKAAIEGLYIESEGILTKDAEVVVYLRNSEPPYKVADGARGIIDRMTLTGIFTFSNISTGQYFIVLKSVNTVETWSKKGGELIIQGTETFYDFTNGKEKAYGDNMKQSGKVPIIYSGDISQDGYVNRMDFEILEKSVYNYVTGNVPEDLNGDGIVEGSDLIIVENNAREGVKSITPLDGSYPDEMIGNFNVQIRALVEGLCNDDPLSMNKSVMVNVFLRNIYPPFAVVAKTQGMLNKDNLYGLFQFGNLRAGRYYIVVKSGSSVETWSKEGGEEFILGGKISYDFTNAKDRAYKENLRADEKHFCIYTGDVNQDGFVNKLDLINIQKDFYKKGALVTDLNGDEIVTGLDYNIAYTNWTEGVKAVTPLNFENTKDVYETSNAIQESFTLEQNNPNPFNPSTQISFNVSNTSNVKLSIYDISGREVAQLVNTVLAAGNYAYEWNASNFASGTYFYRLKANGFEQTMKMQLVK